MRSLHTSQKGAAAVEFALVLPLLVLLVFGIIEFSIFLFDKAVITNASREGARQAIVFHVDSDGNYTPLDDAAIQSVVSNYADAHLISFEDPRPNTETIINPALASRTRGTNITVTVNYTYGHLFLPITQDMSATTVMRME